MKIILITLKKKTVILSITLCVITFFISFLIVKNDAENKNYISTASNRFIICDTEHHKRKLAIIIDDFGEARDGIDEMMNIKRHLTFAVMPFLTHSIEDAEKCYSKNFEVILHLPLESKYENGNSLGKQPILTCLSDENIKKIVIASFDSVPFAVGANIHMGSAASEDKRVMHSVLEIVKMKSFYFVDSKTSAKSVCPELCNDMNIKYAERNVFLEYPSNSKHDIKEQLALVGEIAIKKGFAIAIGHVGSEGGIPTAEAINEMIPVLEEKGIEFVFASELFKP